MPGAPSFANARIGFARHSSVSQSLLRSSFRSSNRAGRAGLKQLVPLSPTESVDHKLITQREALELLEAVRDGQPIARERAEQFARAVLELDPLGRLALAVLDGGLFAGTRLVELAELVLTAGGETTVETGAGS